MGARLPVSHPVFAWMIEAAADYVNRFRESRPGSTPIEIIRGQHQPRKMADFGECVFFLPAKDNKEGMHKADEKFSEGIWLGMNPRTGEAIIGTDNGIEMARTVRRKVESEAFDHRKILSIKIAPWDRRAMQEAMPQVNLDAWLIPRETQIDPQGLTASRAYIYKADIEEAGYSENCPGC